MSTHQVARNSSPSKHGTTPSQQRESRDQQSECNQGRNHSTSGRWQCVWVDIRLITSAHTRPPISQSSQIYVVPFEAMSFTDDATLLLRRVQKGLDVVFKSWGDSLSPNNITACNFPRWRQLDLVTCRNELLHQRL
jgi:hypothetical protein